MKGKKLLSTSLLAILIIALTPVLISMPSVSAAPQAKVWIDPTPKSFIGPPSNPYEWNNTQFTLQVKVANVTDLYGFEVYVQYNTTLLSVVSMVCTGSGQVVHGTAGVDYAYYTAVPYPDVIAGVCGFLTAPSFNVSGSSYGVLVWLTFKIIYAPPQIVGSPAQNSTASCTLDLSHYADTVTILYDSVPNPIPSTNVNGFYSYIVEGLAPGTPTAEFTYPSTITVGSVGTLTDTSNPGASAWIVTRKWTLDNATRAHFTSPDNMSTRTFQCDAVGNITVTLQVWNNYNNTDSKSHTITQEPKPTGCQIDLFTSARRFCGQMTTQLGKGANVSCDALSPDVNVTLYANVTFNQAPVMHVLVSFEVMWVYYINFADITSEQNPVLVSQSPWSQYGNVLVRTAETNKTGIATVWFRVPTPCNFNMTGKWEAIATDKVQEVKQNDTMWFDVGHYITLVTSPLQYHLKTDKSSYVRDQDWITISFMAKNIGYMPQNVTFVVTVYDVCDVPIAKGIIKLTVPAGYYCHPYHFNYTWTDAVYVPQWAYVGTGTVYLDALTKLPIQGGNAYCPETSCTFAVIYVP